MISSETLSNTDRTSWRRVVMVGQYFWPVLKKKVIIIPIVSLLIFIAADFIGLNECNRPAVMLINMLTYLIILSPVFFAKRPSDEVFCSLPANGLEKCIFVFGYSYVIVPLLVFLPGDIYFLFSSTALSPRMLVNDTFAEVLGKGEIISLTAASILTALTCVAAGLWAVFASNKHKTVNCVLTIIAIFFINASIGFVLGVIVAICGAEQQIAEDLPQLMHLVIPYITAFWSISFVFATLMAARAICNKQT